jgi:hypothetical protein
MSSNKRERQVWLRNQLRSSYNDTFNRSQVDCKALDEVKDGWVPQKINMLSKYVQYDLKVLNGVVFNGVQDEFKSFFDYYFLPKISLQKASTLFQTIYYIRDHASVISNSLFKFFFFRKKWVPSTAILLANTPPNALTVEP